MAKTEVNAKANIDNQHTRWYVRMYLCICNAIVKSKEKIKLHRKMAVNNIWCHIKNDSNI